MKTGCIEPVILKKDVLEAVNNKEYCRQWPEAGPATIEHVLVFILTPPGIRPGQQ